MAPSKRQIETEENVSKSVTRSETLLLAAQKHSTNSRFWIAAAVPKRKRTKTTRKKKATVTWDQVKRDKSDDEKIGNIKVEVKPVADVGKENSEAGDDFGVEKQIKEPSEADAVLEKGTQRAEAEEGDKTVSGNAGGGCGKVLIIEHCVRCKTIKMTANMVKEALKIAVPDVQVIVNPVKPRERSLQIREEGGRVFLSLLDMKRPFAPMKNLNMDEVISDIIDKIL